MVQDQDFPTKDIFLFIFFRIEAQEPIHTEINETVRKIALEESQVMDIASWLCDVYGPRLTGSPMLDKATSWAVEKLGDLSGENQQDPFFLSVGFFLPHVPLFATQKWFDMYPEETLQLPPILEYDRDDTPRFSWYDHWDLPEPRLKWLEDENQLPVGCHQG